MKKSITTKNETHTFGFSKRDIAKFERAAASAGMKPVEWAKAVLRGAADCELEPVPAASASPDEETASLVIKLSKRDIARCRRAAVFCDIPFDEWLRDSILSSMECDEDDLSAEGPNGGGREFPLGRDRIGWQNRESLPDPIAQGF